MLTFKRPDFLNPESKKAPTTSRNKPSEEAGDRTAASFQLEIIWCIIIYGHFVGGIKLKY